VFSLRSFLVEPSKSVERDGATLLVGDFILSTNSPTRAPAGDQRKIVELAARSAAS